jgi:uncharacterized membrane protein YedE/YeeE
MKNAIAAFAVGFIFALGLGVSGMTQPQKVVGFLNLFGAWDPSLMFVMMGAIGVHFFTYKVIRQRTSPLLASTWQVPTKKDITPSLIFGSVLFGIGWGLAGFCPGPAIASVASMGSRPIMFLVSMLVGMYFFKLADHKFKFKR